jgi:hypothetical protein
MEQILMRISRNSVSSTIALASLIATTPLSLAQAPSTGSPPAQTAPPASSTSGAASAPPTEHLSQYLGVSAYPSKGQTSKQQTLDEKACFDWAKANTGIDPLKLNESPPAQTAQTNGEQNQSNAGKGERGKGAVRGAAAGAAIGAIAGDTGKGAAIGATAGTFQGGRRKREAEAQQQGEAKAEQEKQQSAAAEQVKAQKQSYNNAFSACLTGKGYAVK